MLLRRCAPRLARLSALAPAPAAHPSFTLVRVEELPEHASRAAVYRHSATGAEVFSLCCPTEREKVFGAAFRTVPGDDTGVAHVLEHSVLCGSARYPSKEPFVTLMSSSLQTYLNAMTYGDRTVYPVASPNLADFYNLCRVYLDAVLSPRLGKWALAQEGWHFEVGADRALRATGVVLNEMKGVYSNPDSLHAMACEAALFPANAYSRSSGGDPLAITALTPEAFAAFHAENYHPSRARFWFFGDDPEAARLALLEEFLAPLAGAPPPAAPRRHPAELRPQPPFAAPAVVVLPYPARGGDAADDGTHPPLVRPADPLAWDAPAATRAGYDPTRGPALAVPGEGHYVTLSWSLGGVHADPTRALAHGVLSHLLMGTDTAPLRKALTDSGLGTAVTGGGFDGTGDAATWAAGLKGVGASGTALPPGADARVEVERVVFAALAAAAAPGSDAFSPSACAAALNTVEFALREFSASGGTRGLGLLLSAAGALVGPVGDPLAGLRFERALAGVRATYDARGGAFFAAMLSGELLANPHRATLHMWPDGAWMARREGAEAAWLAGRAAALGPRALEGVAEEAAALAARQAAPDAEEDIAKIPTLTVADLDATPPRLERACPALLLPPPAGAAAPAPPRAPALVTAAQPTAGIGYLQLTVSLEGLPLRLAPLLPLFAWALTNTGTASRDEIAFARAVGAATGGVSARATFSGDGSLGGGTPALVVAGKALRGRAHALGELAGEALVGGRLDARELAVTWLKEREAGFEGALGSAGHSAGGRLLDAVGGARGAWVADLWGGLAALRVTRALLARLSHPAGAGAAWESLLDDLHAIRAFACARAGGGLGMPAGAPHAGVRDALVSVVGDADVHAEFAAAGRALWAAAASAAPRELPAAEGPWQPPAPGAPPPPLPLWPFPRSEEEVAAGMATGDARVNVGVTPAVLARAGGAAAVGGDPRGLDFSIVIPSSVNFVVKKVAFVGGPPPEAGGAPAAPYALPPPLPARPPSLSAALAPAVAVLNTGLLWDRVRVQGGAYGAGAALDGATRTATFYSYRDPHVARTLEEFGAAGGALAARARAGGRAPAREVAHAVISTIGEWDSPLSPKARGGEAVARWVSGASEPLEAARRAAVLGAGPAAVAALGEGLEAGAGVEGGGRAAVVGGAEALAAWPEGARPRLTLKPL